MNIQKALKTNLPLKRKRDSDYFNRSYLINCTQFTEEDLLANDWQVKRKEGGTTKNKSKRPSTKD